MTYKEVVENLLAAMGGLGSATVYREERFNARRNRYTSTVRFECEFEYRVFVARDGMSGDIFYSDNLEDVYAKAIASLRVKPHEEGRNPAEPSVTQGAPQSESEGSSVEAPVVLNPNTLSAVEQPVSSSGS